MIGWWRSATSVATPSISNRIAWRRCTCCLTESRATLVCGVRLVISDDHAGLVKAIDEQFLGAAWQRCRVHLTRNAQDLVPRSARSMVASAIRMVIEQPDGMSAREQLDRVIDSLRARFPAVAELLTRAEAGLLAHFAFPRASPAPDPQHEPARAAQQGDPSAEPRSSASSRRGRVSSAWSA